MTKYNAKKTTIDGITFDSQKEANRYCELKLLEKAGIIKGLELQPKYELTPKFDGIRASYYKADFLYWENGLPVVEDVKGFKTKEYLLKKKIMKMRYGIDIREV